MQGAATLSHTATNAVYEPNGKAGGLTFRGMLFMLACLLVKGKAIGCGRDDGCLQPSLLLQQKPAKDAAGRLSSARSAA
jgi:hypothetical protein